MSGAQPTVWRVDADDKLVHVNDEWDRFAHANGGGAALSARVLQRPIWDFISDASVRHLYHHVLARARARRLVEFEFRCDSPRCERLLAMRVAAVDGAVEFRADVRWTRARAAPPLLDPARPHSEAVLRMCAWCTRIADGVRWLDLDEAIVRLRLFESAPLPQISHGICEVCMDRIYRTMGR